MLVSRWIRSLARVVFGIALFAPAAALPLAVVLDRGPSGETRISSHLFPLVLWWFDDFAWTCTRNSVMFATIVSLLSLGVGGVIGWALARRRFWGRGMMRVFAASLLVVSPAFLALGLGGLLGSPCPWPWPFASRAGLAPGVSLESWRSLPLWIVWIWTTLPCAVAFVALVTGRPVEQLEPSWEDAARLTGAGAMKAWRTLTWPLVRPSSCRAAALVFVFALADPGTPLVLGLRRTLGFQLVEAARRTHPFPDVAAWAVITGLIGLAGWIIWRWVGGAPILERWQSTAARPRARRSPRSASSLVALAATVLIAGWAVIGWLPLAGLIQLVIGGIAVGPRSTPGGLHAFLEYVRRLMAPPVPQLMADSVILGLEVACVTLMLAWLVGPASRGQRERNLRERLAQIFGVMPPLVLGVGLMAVPWLAGSGAAYLVDVGAWRPLATALRSIADGCDPVHNAWVVMSCAVALALVPRVLASLQKVARSTGACVGTNSAYEAALLANASGIRARRLSQSWPRGRWLALGLLVASLAATNLTPALLFEPWTDGRTIAPAVVILAAGPADDRSQAAALALFAVAVNLAALAIARLSSALPHALDLD